jgi:hypothetical protein
MRANCKVWRGVRVSRDVKERCGVIARDRYKVRIECIRDKDMTGRVY